jgi:hypothetical protein
MERSAHRVWLLSRLRQQIRLREGLKIMNANNQNHEPQRLKP